MNGITFKLLWPQKTRVNEGKMKKITRKNRTLCSIPIGYFTVIIKRKKFRINEHIVIKAKEFQVEKNYHIENFILTIRNNLKIKSRSQKISNPYQNRLFDSHIGLSTISKKYLFTVTNERFVCEELKKFKIYFTHTHTELLRAIINKEKCLNWRKCLFISECFIVNRNEKKSQNKNL